MLLLFIQLLALWVFAYFNIFHLSSPFFWHPVCYLLSFSFQNIAGQILASPNRPRLFYPHIIVAMGSTVCGLIGGAVIFTLKGGLASDNHFQSYHSWAGAAASTTALIHGSVASGLLWPGFLSGVASRSTRLFLHRTVAKTLLVFYTVALVLGFAKIGLPVNSVQGALGALIVTSLSLGTLLKMQQFGRTAPNKTKN